MLSWCILGNSRFLGVSLFVTGGIILHQGFELDSSVKCLDWGKQESTEGKVFHPGWLQPE